MDTNVGSRTIVSPLFLFGCTVITFCLIALVLNRLSGLAYNEQPIHLKQVTAQMPDAQQVEVGLFIDNFDKFDLMRDELIFNGVLTFDFDAKNTEILEELHNVTFAHAKVLYRSEPMAATNDGRTRVYYQVRVQIFENLNFAWFPFEDHRLSIVVVDQTFNKTPVTFVATKADFRAPDMGFQGWHKFAEDAEAGYLEESIKQDIISYPAAVFSIDYGRHTNVRNIFMIIFPMLLLFLIALFSLIIDPQNNFTFVLTVPVTAIAGLISFRFVVEAMSPKVGYFMYSDYFFLLFLCLMFGILIFNTFGYAVGSFVRKIMLIAFDLIVVLFCFLMVYHIDLMFRAHGG
jgi:hypothetical protein